jgi:DNA-directed RNA polymerase I subunit RPA1
LTFFYSRDSNLTFSVDFDFSGLFRKNMMGKRVDYSCRSVISPDPYVGTNEIGLPRYFAEVLTYPTPVTDRNIKEMRQLVERGVEYPGARWVEFEGGHRVDLSKMTKHKRDGLAASLLIHLKKGQVNPLELDDSCVMETT